MIERVEFASLSEGDIVLVDRDRRLFAHRLIKRGVGNSGLLTRGDAMRASDPLVDQRKLLGRVSYILRNGKCIEPRKTLRVSERAVAVLVQHSEIAARVVVGIHGLGKSSQSQSS
jgi:hypothetical protein